MFECEELEAKRDIYLATNISCTDRWYNILRKYSFATEGVCLGTVPQNILIITFLATKITFCVFTKKKNNVQKISEANFTWLLIFRRK